MARLTKAPQPKFLITDKRRRHTDPPNLWLAVATGSVLFHLLFAVVILPLQGRRAGQEPQLDPVAIDLVEIDPATTNPVAIAPNAPQSNAAAQQSEPQPSSTAPPIEAFPAPPPDPQSTPEPSPEPIPEPSPEPIPEAPVEPRVEAPSDPGPSPPTESEQPADSTSSENLGSNEADPAPVNDADNATTDPANDSAVAEGGENANPTSPTSDPGLPGVTVNSNASPTGWVTSAIVSQRPDRPFDVPTQIATVKPGRDRLPDPTSFGCPAEPGMETTLTQQEQYAQYLAEANPYLGTPVDVHVTVEATGQVSEAQVGNTSSGSNAYDQLAVCLVQNWLEFNPALRDGVPWASDNQQVTITISSIQ